MERTEQTGGRRRRIRGRLGRAACLALAAGLLLGTPAAASGGGYGETAENAARTGGQGLTEEELARLEERVADGMLGELDFREIEQVVEDAFPEKRIRFYDLFSALVQGGSVDPALVRDFAADAFFYAIRANRPALAYLLILVITAAVFSNFAAVFRSRQTAQLGFYLVYMLLITACLQAFRATAGSVEDSLRQLVSFMEVLSPVYFLSMAFAVGSVSAVAFYQITLLLIFLVELVILRVILPLIQVYLMVQMLNFLTEETYLTKLGEFIQVIVGWSLKAMLALVTGLGLFRGVLSPALDTVRRSAFARGAEMIPGVGDILGGTTEIVLGTAVLVKNSIGMAGAALAVGICLVPIFNMGVLTLMYRGMAALIQPISDRRITEAVNSVGLGCQLLLRVVFTTGVLFLITIGVAAAAAG